jgi:hypothetical protein
MPQEEATPQAWNRGKPNKSISSFVQAKDHSGVEQHESQPYRNQTPEHFRHSDLVSCRIGGWWQVNEAQKAEREPIALSRNDAVCFTCRILRAEIYRVGCVADSFSSPFQHNCLGMD